MRIIRLTESDLVKLVRQVINEETTNLVDFVETLKSTYEMSDELADFVVDFIEKSDCQKIEFADFKYYALGVALHNGVLINNVVLNRSLEFALFVIFHEVAHQYQYKKYGEEKMYELYNDEISLDDGAKFMKEIELTADNFASRKIRQLQNMGLIDGKFISPEFYKNVPQLQIVNLIKNIRTQLSRSNITSPDDISKYFYNSIKNNI